MISDSSIITTATTAMINLQQNQQSFSQLILLQPLSIDEFQLIAEDTIEMRFAEPKNLIRFMVAALPEDNIYFLSSPRELIEVNFLILLLIL